MATGVSMLMQMMSDRYKEEEREGEQKGGLVTRDFLDAMSATGDSFQRDSYDQYPPTPSYPAFTQPPPLYKQQQQQQQPPPNLELNLYVTSSSSSSPRNPPAAASCRYSTTICTLDKVKSALERFGGHKKNQSDLMPPKDEAMVAVGCTRCLLYVLVSRSRPRCPRCESPVPLLPEMRKRARVDVDLNSALF